jgi:transcriptional regulator with XRE-family HTH domain
MKVKRKVSKAEGDNADFWVIGRRIREVRGFDLTQAEFARQLGVSQSQLSKYERGLAPPAADVLIRIKRKFGVSIDWLLTGAPKR